MSDHSCRGLRPRRLYCAVGDDGYLSADQVQALPDVTNSLYVPGHEVSSDETVVGACFHDEVAIAVQRVAEADAQLYGMW